MDPQRRPSWSSFFNAECAVVAHSRPTLCIIGKCHMIEQIFQLSDSVRYVAIYKNGQLESKSKSSTTGASSSESDRYEELLVNPTLLKLASQRGDIDCGGMEYVLVRYGNFFQFVLPVQWGHVSVCIEKDADPIEVGLRIKSLVEAAS
jgi:hypothetical protein